MSSERRAALTFWFLIAGMVASIVAAGIALRRASATLLTSADPRFPTHYAVGATMPFPVIMDHDRGWPFLAIYWALIAMLGLLSLAAAAALARTGDRAPRLLAGGLICVLAVATMLPVTFSLDEYAYTAFGRLLGVDHANPYVEHLATGVRVSDPVLAQLAGFLGTPLPDENYGPLWTMLAGMMAVATSGGGLGAAVWAQRAAGAIALVAAAIGMLRLTRAAGAGESARRTALFALHPVALTEFASAGHNDVLMLAPAIWSFALVDASPIAAGALAGAAIAVKYVACLMLPFLAIRAYHARGWASALVLVALGLAVPTLLFVPLWPGFSAFTSLLHLQTNLIVSPLWLLDMWSQNRDLPFLLDAAALLAGLVAAISIVRYARARSPANVFRSTAAVIWASPQLNPWYVSWLLPAVAAGGRWGRYAWWFALFAPLRYMEDALRFPSSSADLATRLSLLEWTTVAILVAPIVLAFVQRLPFQRDAADDA